MSLAPRHSSLISRKTLVAATALLSSLVAVAQASAQQRLSSHVTEPGGGFETTIIVCNAGGDDQQITVSWFDKNGKPLEPESFTVPAGETLLIEDVPAGFTGAAIMSADVPLPVVVNTQGQSDGATRHRTYNAVPQNPDERTAASIFYPIRQGEGAATSYTIVSVGASSCAETFTYVSGDGLAHPNQLLQLGAGKSKTLRHTALFPATAFAPDPGGTVGANTCEWIGSATVTNAAGYPSVITPKALDDLSLLIALPYMPASSQGSSTNVLLNPNGISNPATIDYYDLRGSKVGSRNTTIGRNKTLEGLLDVAFEEPTSALLTMTSVALGRTEVTVTGSARDEAEFYTAIPGVSAENAVSNNGVAFGAELSDESEVEVRVVNMGSTKAKVQVTIFDASGKRLQRKRIKLEGNATGILPYPDQATGAGVYAHLKVLNGGPVAAGLLESWDSGEILYYPAWTLSGNGSVARSR